MNSNLRPKPRLEFRQRSNMDYGRCSFGSSTGHGTTLTTEWKPASIARKVMERARAAHPRRGWLRCGRGGVGGFAIESRASARGIAEPAACAQSTKQDPRCSGKSGNPGKSGEGSHLRLPPCRNAGGRRRVSTHSDARHAARHGAGCLAEWRGRKNGKRLPPRRLEENCMCSHVTNETKYQARAVGKSGGGWAGMRTWRTSPRDRREQGQGWRCAASGPSPAELTGIWCFLYSPPFTRGSDSTSMGSIPTSHPRPQFGGPGGGAGGGVRQVKRSPRGHEKD